MPWVSSKRFRELEEKQQKLSEEFDRLYRYAEWHSRRNMMAGLASDIDEEFSRIFTDLRKNQLEGYRYCWVTLEWHKRF